MFWRQCVPLSQETARYVIIKPTHIPRYATLTGRKLDVAASFAPPAEGSSSSSSRYVTLSATAEASAPVAGGAVREASSPTSEAALPLTAAPPGAVEEASSAAAAVSVSL